MAKIRIGFSTHFEIENELAGIGTDNPTNTKQVLGNIKSSDAKVIGITTLTTFDGFTDTKLSLQGSAGAKQHTTSGEIIIEGDVTVSTGTTFTSGPENLTVTDNFTLPGISDDKPSVGTTRFNENLGALEFYTGVEWRAVNSRVDMGNAGRGVFGGGRQPSSSGDGIFKISIPTQGNADDFGNLSVTSQYGTGCSNRTRGLFMGGYSPAYTNRIEYVTIQSSGTGIDFGDLNNAMRRMTGSAVSSSTRGIVGGGRTPSTTVNVIDYVEIDTTGNAQDFGDLVKANANMAGCSDPTRAIWVGGSPDTKFAQKVTIASKGNSVSLGYEEWLWGASSSGNSVRGIWSAGKHEASYLNSILYMNMASEGKTQYFGDLSDAGAVYCDAVSNETRHVRIGGYAESPYAGHTVMDYVTISTSGNATDFGDTMGLVNHTAFSDSHGGLGGF